MVDLDTPHNDIFADLNLTAPPARKPGRAKGLPRVAGSGRKAGVPNKTTADVRQTILDRAAPVDVLVAVAAGKRMRCGSEIKIVDGKPRSVPIWQQPTIEQRLKAATILLNKVAPDLKASEITADIASRSDIHVTDDTVPTALEVAHRLAFILRSAHDAAQAPQIINAEATPVEDALFEDDEDCADDETGADDADRSVVDQASQDRELSEPHGGEAPARNAVVPKSALFSKTDDPNAEPLQNNFSNPKTDPDDPSLIERLYDEEGCPAVDVRLAGSQWRVCSAHRGGVVLAVQYSREDAARLARSILEHRAYR